MIAADALIASKAVTREMGEGPVPVALLTFVAEEFEAASVRAEGDRSPIPDEARAEAVRLYRQVVERMG